MRHYQLMPCGQSAPVNGARLVPLKPLSPVPNQAPTHPACSRRLSSLLLPRAKLHKQLLCRQPTRPLPPLQHLPDPVMVRLHGFRGLPHYAIMEARLCIYPNICVYASLPIGARTFAGNVLYTCNSTDMYLYIHLFTGIYMYALIHVCL